MKQRSNYLQKGLSNTTFEIPWQYHRASICCARSYLIPISFGSTYRKALAICFYDCLISWSPPLAVGVKLNTDGCVYAYNNKAGFGGLFREKNTVAMASRLLWEADIHLQFGDWNLGNLSRAYNHVGERICQYLHWNGLNHCKSTNHTRTPTSDIPTLLSSWTPKHFLLAPPPTSPTSSGRPTKVLIISRT